MKKYIKLLFSSALFAVSCVPEDDSVFANSFEKAATVDVEEEVDYVKDESDGVDLPLELLGESKAKDIKSVVLFAEFVPVDALPVPGHEQQVVEIQIIPNTATITKAQLLSLAGKNSLDDLNEGDQWIVKYQVKLTDGRVLVNGVNTFITFYL